MEKQSSAVCVVGSAVSARGLGSRADGPRIVGVIGSRSLPLQYSEHVGAVVEDLLKRKNHIASGGSVGTDEFVLSHLVHIGESARGTLYSPWSTYEGFPVKVRSLTRQFKDFGGSIICGDLIFAYFVSRQSMGNDRIKAKSHPRSRQQRPVAGTTNRVERSYHDRPI